MSVSVERESVEVLTPEGRASTVLKRDSLGLTALFFCIATAAAPMTAMLFNVPVIVSGAGWALWFRGRDAARYEAVGRFVHEEA